MLRRQLASHNPDIHNFGTGRGTGQVSAHATAKEATQLARSAWWNGGAASPPGTVARASLRSPSAQLSRSGRRGIPGLQFPLRGVDAPEKQPKCKGQLRDEGRDQEHDTR